MLRREKAIKDLLARSAPLLDKRITGGLVERVDIPLSWVNEAKVRYSQFAQTCPLSSRSPSQLQSQNKTNSRLRFRSTFPAPSTPTALPPI